MNTRARPLAALLVALVSGGCGSRWQEQHYYSYEVDPGGGASCLPPDEARPYLEYWATKDDGREFVDPDGSVEDWTVDEGPFASAARAEEARLPPAEWTLLRCTYLVTVRWRQGI